MNTKVETSSLNYKLTTLFGTKRNRNNIETISLHNALLVVEKSSNIVYRDAPTAINHCKVPSKYIPIYTLNHLEKSILHSLERNGIHNYVA